MDSLLGQKKPQPVLEVTDSLLRKDPRDGRRSSSGIGSLDLQKPGEANRRFQAFLDLTVGDDEQNALSKAWTRDPKLKAAPRAPRGRPELADPFAGSDDHVLQIRRARNLDNRVISATRSAGFNLAPRDFGQARMAALGWLLGQARKEGPAKGEEP